MDQDPGGRRHIFHHGYGFVVMIKVAPFDLADTIEQGRDEDKEQTDKGPYDAAKDSEI